MFEQYLGNSNVHERRSPNGCQVLYGHEVALAVLTDVVQVAHETTRTHIVDRWQLLQLTAVQSHLVLLTALQL